MYAGIGCNTAMGLFYTIKKENCWNLLQPIERGETTGSKTMFSLSSLLSF